MVEYHGKKIPLSESSGVVCRIVDFPAVGEDGTAFMHRTQSLDFGMVLKGTIKLILDDGVEKTMSEGDIVVQRSVDPSRQLIFLLFSLNPSTPLVLTDQNVTCLLLLERWTAGMKTGKADTKSLPERPCMAGRTSATKIVA